MNPFNPLEILADVIVENNRTMFLKLPESDKDKSEWWSFQNEFYKKARKGEDEILIKVLTAYLKRVPDVEDYKRCQMIYRSGIDDQYTFCYDNFQLGTIKRSFEGMICNVTFAPKK